MIKSQKNIGRLELLAWLNELTESDYPRIENCCDGVAYCQVLDSIEPTLGVPLQKLNFMARSKDECARNLKVFGSAIKKARLHFALDIANVSNGKFQANMEVVQWLYAAQLKIAPKASLFYCGFERRMEAYRRQLGIGSN